VEVILDEEVKPEILVQDGKVVTSSRNVAGVFLKPHNDVLKAIRNLDCSQEFTEGNFSLSEYKDSTGRSLPMYLMTFDGFVFLAMGFTGKRAAQFKEAYIREFNKMREALLTPPSNPTPIPQPVAIPAQTVEMDAPIATFHLVLT